MRSVTPCRFDAGFFVALRILVLISDRPVGAGRGRNRGNQWLPAEEPDGTFRWSCDVLASHGSPDDVSRSAATVTMTDPSHSVSAPPAQAAAIQEGCPTPLAWQQVVEAVRREGIPHRIDTAGYAASAVSIGEGPPIYLLPGFLGDHEQFVLTAWLLRDEYCCVMLDPPTIRPAGRVPPDALLTGWAESVLHLADSLGHDRLRIYGTSFGSQLALQMMMTHPERLRAVALHCAFARWRLTPFEKLVVAVGRRSRRTVGAVKSVMRIQQQNNRRWFPPFDTTRWEFHSKNIAATPASAAALRAHVAARVDLRNGLPQAGVPTMLIQTEGDGRAARTAQHELLSGLPNVRVEHLDNTGRLPHITHPHRLAKLLRTFWDDSP
jgi:pimeloyl-ACP methyl ester carboxylesterase